MNGSGPVRSHLVRRVLPYLRPFRWGILGMLPLTLAVAAMDAVEPLLTKAFFDALLLPLPGRSTWLAIAALAGLEAARQVLTWMLNTLTWRLRTGVHSYIQRRLVQHLLDLPVQFHRGETVGGLAKAMEQALNGFVGSAWSIASGTAPNVAYLLLSSITMALLDIRLFLLVLAFTPLPVLLGVWAAKEQKRRETYLTRRWTLAQARLYEIFAGVRTVKSFARERFERRAFMRVVDETNRTVVRGVGRDSAIGGANAMVAAAARLSAAGFGGYLVVRGEATVGTVVAFVGYVSGLFGPVQGLTGIYQTVQRTSVYLRTLVDFFDATDPTRDEPGAVPLEHVRGDVVFERVGFSYPSGSRVLHEINFRARSGETVAFVGPSGAGKTTLVSLLQRADVPTSGRILIDGRDLRELRARSLRKRIGAVLQDTFLFNDTIRANIAYSMPGATQEQVEAAAMAANAHEFVRALPRGYATLVGEQGSCLSTGQRQRIAVARALLGDPPIVILDEATAALDAESEFLVQQALERLKRGRTIFLIAHRLSTVVDADRILILREGRITEVGTHEELMRTSAYYGSLVRRQARGRTDREARAPTHDAGSLPS